MEIRLHLEDAYVSKMKKYLGKNNAGDVIQEALDLLTWSVDVVKNGECIGSIKEDESISKKITTPGLKHLKKQVEMGHKYE